MKIEQAWFHWSMNRKTASMTVHPVVPISKKKCNQPNQIWSDLSNQIYLDCKSLPAYMYNCTYFNTASISSKEERNVKLLLTFVFCVSFQLCQLTNNILTLIHCFHAAQSTYFQGSLQLQQSYTEVSGKLFCMYVA